jgi:hypothetical protein
LCFPRWRPPPQGSPGPSPPRAGRRRGASSSGSQAAALGATGLRDTQHARVPARRDGMPCRPRSAGPGEDQTPGATCVGCHRAAAPYERVSRHWRGPLPWGGLAACSVGNQGGVAVDLYRGKNRRLLFLNCFHCLIWCLLLIDNICKTCIYTIKHLYAMFTLDRRGILKWSHLYFCISGVSQTLGYSDK